MIRQLCVLWLVAISGYAATRNPSALTKLTVDPSVAWIRGAGNTHYLLFTGIFADGTQRDVTSEVSVRFDVSGVVRQTVPGVFEAQSTGIVKLQASLSGQEAESVIIVQPRRSVAIDFATEVAPVFSKVGCNNTNCHGAIKGQNGFKLSLFGYDPDADYEAIVQSSNGRRLNLREPEKSLLLLKPTFTIPHGGGRLLQQDLSNHEYASLLRWIQAGVPKSNRSSPRLMGLEIFPKGFQVMRGEGAHQQIVTVGRYSDGSQEDDTPRVRYTSSNDAVVEVSPQGRVTPKEPGEAIILVRSLGQVAAVQFGVASVEAVATPVLARSNFIDELVFEKLEKMNIEPSGISTDAEFLRRVYLDLIGTLPTAEEAREFMADCSPAKRAKWIDHLLERLEYADFWALKWGDLLGNDPILVGRDGTVYLQDWLREAFRKNKPYDEFTREILTATGSTWDNGAVNYFARSKEDLATVTAQVFLGLSLECARCHDHPSEKWKREDFIGMAAFFSQISSKGKRFPPPEGIYLLGFDRQYWHPETKQVVLPRFLDGAEPVLRPLEDRRKVLADWTTSPENPWFAKATVNRIWRQLMGRGLVEPVDDLRSTNPASNEALLDRLARDFVKHNFDLKHLMRTIVNSTTYQLSSVPKPSNKADSINYSHYSLRQLTAEQLLDGITQITGVPEKFLGYYPGTRAVNLADPGVPSSFLDMYGRPKREAARCERNQEPSLRQSMNMLVGDTVNQKLRSPGGRLMKMVKQGRSDQEIVQHFYLSSLARYPDPREEGSCKTAIARAATREKGLENMLWALLNSNEFLYNH